MYDLVYEGMPVISVYQPVKIGLRDGVYYLSVSPDIYGRGGVTLTEILHTLRAAGLPPALDLKMVQQAVSKKDGYPYSIAKLLPTLSPQLSTEALSVANYVAVRFRARALRAQHLLRRRALLIIGYC